MRDRTIEAYRENMLAASRECTRTREALMQAQVERAKALNWYQRAARRWLAATEEETE